MFVPKLRYAKLLMKNQQVGWFGSCIIYSILLSKNINFILYMACNFFSLKNKVFHNLIQLSTCPPILSIW